MGATYRELKIEGNPDSILKFAFELCSAYQSKIKHSSYFARDGLHCFWLAEGEGLDEYIERKSSDLGLKVSIIKSGREPLEVRR